MTFGFEALSPFSAQLQLESSAHNPYYVGVCPVSFSGAIGGYRQMFVSRPSGSGSSLLLLAVVPHTYADNWVAGTQYIAEGASSVMMHVSDNVTSYTILAFAFPKNVAMPGGTDGYGMQLFNGFGMKTYDSSFKHLHTAAIGAAGGPPPSALTNSTTLTAWRSGTPICNANPNYGYILPSIDVFVGVRFTPPGEPAENYLDHYVSAVTFAAGAASQTVSRMIRTNRIEAPGTVTQGRVYSNINPNGYYSVAVELAKYL